MVEDDECDCVVEISEVGSVVSETTIVSLYDNVVESFS